MYRFQSLRLALVSLCLGGLASTAGAEELSGFQAAVAMEEAMVQAIAGAEQSVVAIARVRRDDDEPLDFSVNQFGRLQLPARPSPSSPEHIPNEFATVFVVGSDGLILTAQHVLQRDCEYWVTLPDRSIHKARIKAADPRSDLAVLQIDATDLKPITFGDATKLKKGQIVIALGNPYAIARDGQASASWGIVSNLMRKDGPVPDASRVDSKPALHQSGTLIQTDAKLNLGTSGGALLNLQGEMVGLTVSLAAAAGYEQSAGFAIPVDETFQHALERLKQGREVNYGFLGVGVQGIAANDQGRRGVVIMSVAAGTPARRSGLMDGDVITHVNGDEIFDQDRFMLAVGKLPAESSAILRIERAGRPLVIVVDELAKYCVKGYKVVTTPEPAWRGMRVDHVTASPDFGDLITHGRIDTQGSVWVTEVEEGSPAWQQGLRPGMMISHVAGNRVATPGQFFDQVSGKQGPVKLKLHAQAGEEPDRVIAPEAS